MSEIISVDFSSRKVTDRVDSESLKSTDVSKLQIAERQQAVDDIHAMLIEALDAGHDTTKSIVIIPVDDGIGVAAAGESGVDREIATLESALKRLRNQKEETDGGPDSIA